MRTYLLQTNTVASGDNLSSIDIVKPGTIYGVYWSIAATSGATVTGRMAWQLALDSLTFVAFNSQFKDRMISTVELAFNVTSGTVSLQKFVPIIGGVRVAPGNVLRIHTLLSSTAPGSTRDLICVYCSD